jgi:uncharacterized protein (DUF111 family)
MFTHTTTIGIRESAVAKHALRREFRYIDIDIDDRRIAVKLGIRDDGSVVNAMPEWEDVARVAAATGRPVKNVLAQSIGLSGQFGERPFTTPEAEESQVRRTDNRVP